MWEAQISDSMGYITVNERLRRENRESCPLTQGGSSVLLLLLLQLRGRTFGKSISEESGSRKRECVCSCVPKLWCNFSSIHVYCLSKHA